MLIFADYALHVIHLSIISFNLFGWVHPATRRAHRGLVGLTTLCWLGVGLAVGTIGYCPLTDWHWRVKFALGAQFLPHSYIDYLLQEVGFHPTAQAVDIGVGITFVTIVTITLALWWRERQQDKIKT